MRRRDFLKNSIVGVTMMAGGGCTGQDPLPTPVISTSSGKLRGEVVDGVHRFLGIPYAEPPFGKNRWLSPAHRSRWDGILPATHYGAICPQTGGIKTGLPDEGEDCLNLNVWTPDPTSSGLPVMVWAHGGGQTSGTGSSSIYDGTHFARDGVVLVTCNRRLGAEGYLYLEPLFGNHVGPGNLGIQDLIAVLEWVAENIRNFGGDPSNVTLFGESGGGAATQAVVATRGSQGLVHRVIVQSGGHAAQRADTATAVTRHMLGALDIKPGDIDALRQVPWSRLVDLYDSLQSLEAELGQPQIYLPVINEHMPHHPVDAPYEGIGLDVDYLIGTCRDEANLFSALMPTMQDSVFHRRAKQVVDASGLTWDDVIARYRSLRPDLDDEAVFNAVLGDLWFRVPAVRIAQGHARFGQGNTHMYLFEWESPFIGAAHALDVMVFGNGLPFAVLAGFSEYQQTADFMRKAWVRFAHEGSPTLPAHSWPAYMPLMKTMSINQTPTVIQQAFQPEFALFEKVMAANWKAAGL
ncbi:MAG: carboxylesterase family protein [Proteobacteria bacterium]|nr:carboxylesterase family protein [Pseudomonadota bacterium]